jgi:hypothetical protein
VFWKSSLHGDKRVFTVEAKHERVKTCQGKVLFEGALHPALMHPQDDLMVILRSSGGGCLEDK